MTREYSQTITSILYLKWVPFQTEPYLQLLNTVFLILLACEIYTHNSAGGRNNVCSVTIPQPQIKPSRVNLEEESELADSKENILTATATVTSQKVIL